MMVGDHTGQRCDSNQRERDRFHRVLEGVRIGGTLRLQTFLTAADKEGSIRPASKIASKWQ